MKGTVTRLRLLSLAAAVLVVAAVAVASTPRRAPQAAAPQPVVATVVHTATPVATVALAPTVSHRATRTVASETLVPTNVSSSMGMRIYRDPETGDIGIDPSNAGISNPGGELNDSDEGLIEETLWDGSIMIDLQGRYQEVSVMHKSPDGKTWMECSKHPSFTSVPVPAPAPATQYEER